MNIFRSEAIEHHNDTEYGDIILPTSFSLSVCATVTLFIMLSLTVFIYYGSYTRKAHLTGIVMPSSGLVKIIPQYAGYVTQLTVSEGEHVTAGTQLYHISGEHYNG
ncbi:TPA: secretion protein HlyD, partial [Escherichia coli]